MALSAINNDFGNKYIVECIHAKLKLQSNNYARCMCRVLLVKDSLV